MSVETLSDNPESSDNPALSSSMGGGLTEIYCIMQ